MAKDVLLEKNAVETRGQSVSYNAGFHSRMITFVANAATPFYHGHSCLVLGPSEGGEQEEALSQHFSTVVCVDGSSRVLQKLQRRCPSYTYIHSLFEELELTEKFDTILLMHILEHVEDPVALLRRASSWLAAEGHLIITVPNAFSLHRMLGVEMKLLKDVHELNAADHQVGHRRLYDSFSLEKDVLAAHLRIIEKKGVFLKLFNNAQLETLTSDQIEGLYKLGFQFPENAAELLFICGHVS